MKFNLGRAIGGFAKRGMQYNDEQRQLTNDAIVKAVGVAAADTMEQHKARRAAKAKYVSGATKLKGMGLSDAMIEQAYASEGDSAYEKLAASLQAEKTAWATQQQQDGKTDAVWDKNMTQAWLSKQFTGVKGVQGRSIADQSQAFVDYSMPMQSADVGALSQGIAASSGEITFESPEAKQARIQKQMSGMLGAETGGANVSSAPATFGIEGATYTPQASQADIMQQRLNQASVSSAESGATIKEAEAGVIDDMLGQDLKGKKLANQLATQKFDQLTKTNPITIQLLEAQVGKEEAQATIAKANAGNADAMAALDFVIKQAAAQGADLKNRVLVQQLEQDKEKFQYTIDLLGLQIEGQDLSNKMKTVDASNYEELANLNMTLKELEVEGANLRNIGQLQNNELHDLNMEKLEKSIELIDASILEKQSPTTFQAHILQTQTAIDNLDPADPEYDAKLAKLHASQDRTQAQYEMFKRASSGSSDPKFPSLVNAYGKSLEAKLSKAGLGKNLFFPEGGGTPQWSGGEEGRAKFNEIVARHQAQYYQAIGSYGDGPEALEALGIKAPDPAPLKDKEIFDEFDNLVDVRQVIDDTNLLPNQIYLVPGQGVGIALPNPNYNPNDPNNRAKFIIDDL